MTIDTTSTVDGLQGLLDLYEQTGDKPPQWLTDKLRGQSHGYDPSELVRKALECGVPSKYAVVLPDESRVPAMREGTSYYVSGISGDGKTTKAAEMLKGWVANGGDALWVPSLDLLSELRDTYGTGGSELAVIRRYTGCGLLVIDDLGKGTFGRWAVSKLFQVLDARYSSARTEKTEARPTIITSQHRLPALAQIMGAEDREAAQAIASRIHETYRSIDCGPTDRRLG